jgi:hypothetical protein
MKKNLSFLCCLGFAALFLTFPLFAQNAALPPPDNSVPPVAENPPTAGENFALSASDELRLQIIRYGTDTEITNLIKILRNEQPSTPAKTAAAENPLDKELFIVAEKSKNRNILSGIFGYFSDREIGGLETRALAAIQGRDYEAAETVNAAILYLGKLKAAGTRDILMDIMNGEESRFLSGAIRSLGMVCEKDRPSETAEYLITYYKNRDPGDENRRLLIIAIGDTKAAEGTAFLVSIMENEDERTPLRIAALESLSKIADPSGLAAVTSAVSSKDPNVRSSAIGALAPFSGDAVDTAIIEAFRDSFYRTRIAAAKAAGERKLEAAVPFLRFRCENDEVPAVRDEAIKALGLIGGNNSEQILVDLFKDKKNSDRLRISTAETLLSGGFGDHVSDVVAEMDDAKTKNQTVLYNGFLRVLGGAVSPKLEDLARRFFANGGVIEKSFALDICSKNNFRSLTDEVQKLTDPKNGSLSRKSLALLEEWGLSADTSSSASSTAPAVPAPVSN